MVGLESEPCVVKSSVALGMFEGDAVVGYYCDGSAAASAPEAQHLVIARVAQASGEVTRTVIDAELGETVNGSVMVGSAGRDLGRWGAGVRPPRLRGCHRADARDAG